MPYSYLLADDSPEDIDEALHKMESFPEFFCVGSAKNMEETITAILEFHPQIVFLEISSPKKITDLSLAVITNLYQYTSVVPYFIITTKDAKHAYEAIRAGAADYMLKPLKHTDLLKSLMRFEKSNPVSDIIFPRQVTSFDRIPRHVADENISFEDERALNKRDNPVICIKSYGNYQFIAMNDVLYLKADNNSTDFHLRNKKVLTAYKTLKHYENTLPSFFFRVHNSYIVNSKHVSRINTGKSLCYLNNNEISVSFSKTFKDNVDAIIRTIAPEYL